MRNHQDAPDHMRAELPVDRVENAREYAPQKELISGYTLVGITAEGDVVDPLWIRVYMGRSKSSSVVYASVWLHHDGIHAGGRGMAGGGGYHKESAAIGNALDSAGIRLFGSPYCTNSGRPANMADPCHIHGVGETAIRSAMLAIGAALGLTKMQIITH